jgi:hypothetical protein
VAALLRVARRGNDPGMTGDTLTVPPPERRCLACGAEVASAGPFCPQCGRRWDVSPDDPDLPPNDPLEVPVTVLEAHRRPLGLGPASLLVTLSAVALGAGLAALVAGHPWWAALLLVVAAVLAASTLAAARRSDDEAAARALAGAGRGAREWWALAVATVTAWARASRSAVRLHAQVRLLQRRRLRIAQALGAAVLDGDERRAGELKEQGDMLAEELRRAEEELRAELERSRRRVADERGAVAATHVIPPHDMPE